jgi:hypothetical protein
MALTTPPDFADGSLTAAKVQQLSDAISDRSPLPAIKTLDESIISSATFQNDDELFVTLAANAIYSGKLHLPYQSGATPGFKYQFTFPAGTTLPVWSFMGITTVPAFTYGVCNASGGVSGLGGTGANQALDAWGLVLVGSTPGVLQTQWAQNTLTASSTIVRAGAFLELIRLA